MKKIVSWLTVWCLTTIGSIAYGQQTVSPKQEPDSVVHARNRANILHLERELDSLALVYNRMQVETYLEYSHATGQFPSYRSFYTHHIDSLWHDDESVQEAIAVFKETSQKLADIIKPAGFYEDMENRKQFFDSLASIDPAYRKARWERDEAHWNFQVAPLRALLARYQKEGKILPIFFINDTTWKWMLEINPYLEVMKNRVKQTQDRLKTMYQSETQQIYRFQYIPFNR